MKASTLIKLLVTTAIVVVALAATPLAQAGLGIPQKHGAIIGVLLSHGEIIAI
jgi:hypothetical protein